jgi:hypothetical protein
MLIALYPQKIAPAHGTKVGLLTVQKIALP